ncbi:MAG: winged helix-turn-helix domain-containing protein [Deltaproteobacteria bacterium]|nr:winged helix-turn-helix domain-containing protein [Deltaproteobacteria bacterium]
MTEEALELINESDKRNKWETRVRFARNDLVKLGFISNAQRGVWELTERCLELLKILRNNPIVFDSSELHAGHRVVALRKEIYNKLVTAGIDKEKAVKIACGDDIKTVLQVLGNE